MLFYHPRYSICPTALDPLRRAYSRSDRLAPESQLRLSLLFPFLIGLSSLASPPMHFMKEILLTTGGDFSFPGTRHYVCYLCSLPAPLLATTRNSDSPARVPCRPPDCFGHRSPDRLTVAHCPIYRARGKPLVSLSRAFPLVDGPQRTIFVCQVIDRTCCPHFDDFPSKPSMSYASFMRNEELYLEPPWGRTFCSIGRGLLRTKLTSTL